jgi:hypothetical protein
MSANSINASKTVITSAQSMAETGVIANEGMMGIKIIGLMQSFCSLLIIVGLIVGIIYMIKSKKTKEKRILVGAIIIIVPFILKWILNIIRFNMLLNM